MEGLKGEEDLGGVELALLLGEFVLEGEQPEELAAGTVLQYEVEFVLILEALLEFDEERVLQLAEDGLLRHYVLLLVLLDHVLLLQHLHRVHLLVAQATHQQHLRVRPLPYHRQRLVVLNPSRLHHLIIIHFSNGTLING